MKEFAALVDWETHQLHQRNELVFSVNGGSHPSGHAFMHSELQTQRSAQILTIGVSSYSTNVALNRESRFANN